MVVVGAPSLGLLKNILRVVHGHHARVRDKVGQSAVVVTILLWYDIPVRRGVDKHTAGRLPVRDQVHVGVLVVVERVGCCWWRGLWGRYKIVLIIKR